MVRSLTMIGRLAKPVFTFARYRVLRPPLLEDKLPPLARLGIRVLYAMTWAKPGKERPYGVRLRDALVSLGPSYIKLGQFLATRPDVIGQDMARDLSNLQDRLAPFPTEQAKSVIAEALGHPVTTLFETLSDPVAAASIAQVHRAEIRNPDGSSQALAVKVLRPGVAALFARDLDAFAWAARWAVWFDPAMKRMKPEQAVAELARSVALELDLRFEAAAMSEMGETFAHDAEFLVPAVDWDRTGAQVLTLAWVDGIALNDIERLRAADLDLKKLATLVIQTFLRQSLARGFFHADMHPGNLFADAQGRLIAVDYGIVGRLDSSMRRFMAETLHGFLERDYRRVASVHFAVGFVKAPHTVEDFAQALRAIGEPVFGRPSGQISMARLLQQLFDVTRLFGMEMQPQLMLLQKTMVVVEGVARQLDPGHSIWESARPVVEAWMIENLGPEARIRDAAQGVGALGRAVGALPDVLRTAEGIVAQVRAEGIKLHPDTANAIAEAQTARTAHARIALWIAAAAAVVLALGALN